MTPGPPPTPGGNTINTSNNPRLAGIRLRDPDGAPYELERLAGAPTVIQLMRYFG